MVRGVGVPLGDVLKRDDGFQGREDGDHGQLEIGGWLDADKVFSLGQGEDLAKAAAGEKVAAERLEFCL